jgi:hypothetical protein
MKAKEQFLAILKKDIKLVFNWKTILVTVVVPFIMMFLIVGLPTIFIGTAKTTITICNQDSGALVTDANNNTIEVNLGELATMNIQQFYSNTSGVEITTVDTQDEALNASNGIWFPANFTANTFNGSASFQYRQSSSGSSLQGSYFSQALIKVQETVVNVFIQLKLEEPVPVITEVKYEPPTGESVDGWSSETKLMASPFGYAIFILATFVGAMGRTIGFGKEKEDGTFETILTITKNRSYLVYSKIIIGLVASLLSILAYFLGSILANAFAMSIIGSDVTGEVGFEGILAIPSDSLLSLKGFVLLLGLILALLITLVAVMTIDTLFSKQVAERIATPLVTGLGILFYFSIIFNPQTQAFYAVINPFYWIYYSFLSMVDGSLQWQSGIYLVLLAGLLFALVFFARRAIERERVLFT